MKQVTLLQLPLLLNTTLKEKVSDDIDANYRGKVQIDAQVLDVKKEQLLKLLNKLAEKEKVATAFDTVFQSSSANQSVTFADPHRIEQQFDALPHIDLQSLLSALSGNAQSYQRDSKLKFWHLNIK